MGVVGVNDHRAFLAIAGDDRDLALNGLWHADLVAEQLLRCQGHDVTLIPLLYGIWRNVVRH